MVDLSEALGIEGLALEGFAASSEQWVERLRELNQGAAEDAEAAEPAVPPPAAGMIRG